MKTFFSALTILVALPSLAQSHPIESDTTSSSAGGPLILAPHDGEALLFPDGRSAILKVTTENSGATGLMVGTEHIPDGTGIPVHIHDGYEEVIFVHEGRPTLTLGSTQAEAEPGTLMVIPPGTRHGVSSDGESDSTILFIFPEPDIANFFREVGAQPGEPPPQLSPEDWQRILSQHQMRAAED
ncbi:cupin domain-containing protein [uncultured Parasphingopyxis sp.]|uniref:cupin domain-containing protein n=1 Tax=uncultured Parasphingopyxis sp. TaxID=1547918 RepID=UPI002625E90B|nr:cupin domain-containing protein [uncultured Parasphingopyxis sp.]